LHPPVSAAASNTHDTERLIGVLSSLLSAGRVKPKPDLGLIQSLRSCVWRINFSEFPIRPGLASAQGLWTNRKKTVLFAAGTRTETVVPLVVAVCITGNQEPVPGKLGADSS